MLCPAELSVSTLQLDETIVTPPAPLKAPQSVKLAPKSSEPSAAARRTPALPLIAQ